MVKEEGGRTLKFVFLRALLMSSANMSFSSNASKTGAQSSRTPLSTSRDTSVLLSWSSVAFPVKKSNDCPASAGVG